MAVTDWKTPSTAANVDRDAMPAWSNPDNAKTSNNSYAVGSNEPGGYTDWLRLTNFGFTDSDIPPGSTIDGIEVKIERYEGYSYGEVWDSSLRLRKTSGQVGDDKASASEWPTSDTEVTYGGASDDWNASLAQTDIVNSDFGIDFSIYCDAYFSVGYVDCVSVRVYYTPGTTAKTGSDTGAGVDTKSSGNPQATLTGSDAGYCGEVLEG